MKLKDKIKSYSFWVSIASAVILILKVLGGRFGFVVDESMVSDIFTAVCSILVLLGIIVVPSGQSNQTQTNKKLDDINILNNSNEITSDHFDKNLLEENNNTTDNKINLSLNESFDYSSNAPTAENFNIEKPANINTSNTEDSKIQTTKTNAKIDYEEKNDNREVNSLNEDASFDTLKNEEISNIFYNEDKKSTTEIIDNINSNTQSFESINNINTLTQFNLEKVDNEIKTEDDIQNNISIENQQIETLTNRESVVNKDNLCVENNFIDSNIENFKNFLEKERQKFSGDINKYIFELQEEIRRTREKI